jgi:hypothetical protein
LALEREANKVGLKINESKTKYMIAAENERTIHDVGWSVAFGENGVYTYRRRYNFELQREFDSPCVINIVKTNRLLKRPEDLPQKVVYIARPQVTRRQGRPKSLGAPD